nr:hypothetical protein [Tanacetum cinerariifolium]
SMRMEQYLTHTNYALWEVIINGDSLVPEPPAVAIPDEHLLKFHSIKDAKSLWEAIKTRFRGNKESKKMHKTILKQQYENFVASRSERLDKTYDRFQKLISQLELNAIPDEHLLKFHSIKDAKSLWEAIKTRFRGNKESKKMHKTILKQQYENFVASRSERLDKTYDRFQKLISQLELNGKGKSSSSSNSHNVAFVSSKNTRSINEAVNAAHDIPVVGSKEQPSASSYVDDMDLRWQVAMITIRVKRFIKKTGRNLNFNGKEPVDFDKTRVVCYNYHRRGYFARECHAPMNQGNRSGDNERRVVPVETPASALVVQDGLVETPASALVVQDGLGGYDWSYQAEEGPTDFALMAIL